MDGGTFKLMINYQMKVCSILCFEDLDVGSLMTVLEITDVTSNIYVQYTSQPSGDLIVNCICFISRDCKRFDPVKRAKEIFNALDANNDGTITEDEFVTGIIEVPLDVQCLVFYIYLNVKRANFNFLSLRYFRVDRLQK